MNWGWLNSETLLDFVRGGWDKYSFERNQIQSAEVDSIQLVLDRTRLDWSSLWGMRKLASELDLEVLSVSRRVPPVRNGLCFVFFRSGKKFGTGLDSFKPRDHARYSLFVKGGGRGNPGRFKTRQNRLLGRAMGILESRSPSQSSLTVSESGFWRLKAGLKYGARFVR
jgi:hypothetical protein